MALTCFVLGFVVWQASAGVRGQLVARFDLSRGQYTILTGGLPRAGLPEYIRLLRERHGIEVRVVAGCVVSESLGAYVKGYNTVSMAAAEQKFGHGVFRETWADTIKNISALQATLAF